MIVRPLRWPDEIPLWAALHTAVHPENPLTAADVERRQSAKLDTGRFLAFDGADAIGLGAIGRRSSAALPDGRVLVLSTHRQRGVGSALFAAISGCAAEHRHRELYATVGEEDAESRDFAARRGFVQTSRTISLELDLAAIEPPVAELPAGVEIVTLAERPELTRGLYEIELEAVPDIPGEENWQPVPFEQWVAANTGRPGFRPELLFVAVAGDEAAGFALLSNPAAQPATANHDETSVKRAWRGHGIAAALKTAQIRWAKEAGYERLVTTNEERNTAILRLNERLGYRRVAADLHLRGPIAGS